MKAQSIKQLLIGIANDDKKSFAIFFRMYHSRMIRFSLLFVNRYADAEDVVSDVMIKLLKKRDQLPEIINFNDYLFRAVKNQSLNLLKKNSHNASMGLEDIPEDLLTDNYVEPFEKVLAIELQEIVKNLVEKLPPKRKMVYLLIKDEGLRIKEVAELLDISEKTVKKHLELAIRNLRSEIESLYLEKKADTPIIKLRNYNLGLLL